MKTQEDFQVIILLNLLLKGFKRLNKVLNLTKKISMNQKN